MKRYGTTWTQAVGKVWRLPNNSNSVNLVGLNSGSYGYDYRMFCKLVLNMLTQEKNDKINL